MNAYELADQLDNVKYQNGAKPFEMYANMLRQQADRIAELEKQGKPVAWIRSGDDQLSLVKEKNDGYMVWKPLYLSPQTKPLSDDEIFKLGSKLRISTTEIECNWHPVVLEFARAIEERHGIK